MLKFCVVTTAFFLAAYGGGDHGLVGNWREPSGAVIRIAPCGTDVCATLLAIPPDSPETTDKLNPDPTLRTHALCGLVIGKGFHPRGERHAEGGLLYDPKSGKTYHGEMTVEGDTLSLRGYIGFRMFGRSETWTRTSTVPACGAS